MTEKQTVFVESKRMLSIFSEAAFIMPYCFQPSVQICIPFDEYHIFVKDLLKTNIHCLLHEKQHILALKKNDNLALIRLFYANISKAVIKQIVLSELCGKDATIICANFSEARNVLLSNVKYELTKFKSDIVLKSMSDVKTFIRQKNESIKLSGHNVNLFYYAVFTRVLSSLEETEKINII